MNRKWIILLFVCLIGAEPAADSANVQAGKNAVNRALAVEMKSRKGVLNDGKTISEKAEKERPVIDTSLLDESEPPDSKRN